MSKENPSIQELSRRIDQLLNVLNIISRDLADISKSLETISSPAVAPVISATPEEEMLTVEGIRKSFSSDLEEMLIFEEAEDHIMIKTRRFLDSDNFARIASIVRSLSGEYVSAGKNSHFKVPKKMG